MSLRIWMPLDGNIKNYGASTAITMNSNATVNTSGKIGSCYAFNNSNSYISIDSEDLRKIFTGGSRPFSFALWVYRADSTRAILFGDYSLPGNINLNLELKAGYDNAVRFYWAANPDYAFTGSTVPLTTWTHIAVTYSGAELKCYINGVLVNTRTGTLATKNKTSGDFYLGRDSRTGSTTLNGRLNDFRVYDHCLSVDEIKELIKGLVLYYPLNDDIINNKIIDCSGYNRHGLTTATTCPVKTAGSSRNSNAYHFDANTKNFTLNSSFLPIFTTGSVAWWAKITTNGTSGTLPFTGQTTGYYLAASSNWAGAFYNGNVTASGTIKYYIDGVENNTPSGADSKWHYYVVTGINLSAWTAIKLNNYSAAWNAKDACYSDIKFYNTILSADDIAQEYHRYAAIYKNHLLATSEFIEDGLDKASIGINGVTTGNLIEGDYSKVSVFPSNGNIQSVEFTEII